MDLSVDAVKVALGTQKEYAKKVNSSSGHGLGPSDFMTFKAVLGLWIKQCDDPRKQEAGKTLYGKLADRKDFYDVVGKFKCIECHQSTGNARFEFGLKRGMHHMKISAEDGGDGFMDLEKELTVWFEGKTEAERRAGPEPRSTHSRKANAIFDALKKQGIKMRDFEEKSSVVRLVFSMIVELATY